VASNGGTNPRRAHRAHAATAGQEVDHLVATVGARDG
jgi:hypothetical protein